MAKRIDQLDGIRALAISAVFLHHAYQIRLLWMGVDLFFILSGFLITGILLEKKSLGLHSYFRHFYGRRVRRILPPYLLLLLVFSIFFGLVWAHYWYLYLFLMNINTAFNFLYLEGITPLWSLAVEEQFYLVWPFVVYFLSEAAVAWTAGVLVVAAPLLRWIGTVEINRHFAHLGHWPIYALTPFRMDLLAAGALLCIAWKHHRGRIQRYGHYSLALTGVALLSILALSAVKGFSTHANTVIGSVWIYELSLITCTGLMLWALSGRSVRILTLRPVLYLGRISYSVYLIHIVVLLLVGRHIHNKIALTLTAFVITIFYASVSWFFLEKPILREKPMSPHPRLAKV
jgi:peptidoglycan/LPS O-acetylase OafA/YrhL